MSDVVATKPRNTAAPGPYMGFALQPVRLCHHLLREPDSSSVGLEYFEDVSIHRDGDHVVLEQSKNSIAEKAITDRSLALWKTFANWGETCVLRGLDAANVTFVLYAAAPGAIGNLVYQMHAAIDDTAAKLALDTARKLVPKKPDTGFGAELARFLAFDEAFCLTAIKNFQFQSDADPLEPIRQQLRATLPESVVNDFAASGIGMAKEMADTKLSNREAPLVPTVKFRRRFHSFVRKYNLASLLASTTGTPSKEEVSKTIESAPMFVRQLNAVGMQAETVVGAVGACLRTTADKTKWAEDGTIVEDSLLEFDAGLLRRFTLFRDAVEDNHSAADPMRRGRMVYRHCAEVQLPLEGQAVPAHFVEGAYNILADNLSLGWHPFYKDVLGED